MPRLTGQAAIIGFGRLLNTAAASATLIVLARVLPYYAGRESYGAICQLIMLYIVLSQIFTAGIPQSIFYFMPRYQSGERKGFLYQAVVILLSAGLLLGVGLFLGAQILGRVLQSPLLPPLLRVFALYPFFMLPTVAVESAMLHHNRPIASVLFSIFSRVGMFCSLVVPSLLHAPLQTIIWIWVGMAGLMSIIALLLIFSTVRGYPLTWHKNMLEEELRFSFPLALANLLMLSGIYLDRFVISHLYGTDTFAVYNNATIIIPTLGIVANASAVVLMAELSKRTSMGDYNSFLQIWHDATTKAAVLLFAAMGFLAFWSHETISLLFSSRFAESGEVLFIYVWSIPALLVIVQSLFVSMGATRMMLKIPIVVLFFEVVLIFSFHYLFGFLGIAIAAVLARYLGALYGSHLFVRRVTNIGWKRYMPWVKLGVLLLTALCAGALSRIVMLTPIRLMPEIVRYGIELLVFFAIYLVGLHVVRLLNYLIPSMYLPAKWYVRPEVTR